MAIDMHENNYEWRPIRGREVGMPKIIWRDGVDGAMEIRRRTMAEIEEMGAYDDQQWWKGFVRNS